MPNYKGNEATLTKYKPKWKSGDTRTIRVPIALAERILDYARKVDEGIVENPLTDQNIQSLTQVIKWLEDVEQSPRNNFSRQKRELVQKAIITLKSLSQVND
jgi:hypothetical protein